MESISLKYETSFIVSFMIQAANERYLKYKEKKEYYQFEDPDSHAMDEYGRKLYDSNGLPLYEIVKGFTRVSTLSNAQIFALNEMYSQSTLTQKMIDQILEKYISIYSNEINESGSIEITGKRGQGVKFWKIARDLFKTEEQDLIWKYTLNGYGIYYDYAVLDLIRKVEYPTEMGNHWYEMTKIIKKHYQNEWTKIYESKDINLQNNWIFEHFKFIGKGKGYQTFTVSDSNNYGKWAAKSNKI